MDWAEVRGIPGVRRVVGRKDAQLRVLAYLETLSRMSFGLTVHDWYAGGAQTMREVMK